MFGNNAVDWPGVMYDANIDEAGGDLGVGCVVIGPARWFSTSGNPAVLGNDGPGAGANGR